MTKMTNGLSRTSTAIPRYIAFRRLIGLIFTFVLIFVVTNFPPRKAHAFGLLEAIGLAVGSTLGGASIGGLWYMAFAADGRESEHRAEAKKLELQRLEQARATIVNAPTAAATTPEVESRTVVFDIKSAYKVQSTNAASEIIDFLIGRTDGLSQFAVSANPGPEVLANVYRRVVSQMVLRPQPQDAALVAAAKISIVDHLISQVEHDAVSSIASELRALPPGSERLRQTILIFAEISLLAAVQQKILNSVMAESNDSPKRRFAEVLVNSGSRNFEELLKKIENLEGKHVEEARVLSKLIAMRVQHDIFSQKATSRRAATKCELLFFW